MAIRYQDAITDDRLDAASHRLTEARAHDPDTMMIDLAIEIVREMFCFCIVDEPDALPGHPGSIHQAIAADIIARAVLQDAVDVANRRIDTASVDSFPASDPPSWIYAH